MENTSDLRKYIEILVRHARLIIGLVIVCGAIGLGVALLQAPSYQATALIAVTRPLYQFYLAPQIANVNDSNGVLLAGKAALDIATSDTLFNKLLASVPTSKPLSLRQLKGSLKVTPGSDPSIVRLTASSESAAEAAQLANTWANLYMQELNTLYGQSDQQVEFFKSQMTSAKSDLDKADQDLIEFEKRDNSSVLKAQLEARTTTLSTYLNTAEWLRLLLQNVNSLRDQLARQPAGQPSTLGDQLSTLMLQVNTFKSQPVGKASDDVVPSGQSSLPFQLQIPITDTLTAKTAGEQTAFLNELAKTIQARQVELQKQNETLPAEIMALQGQIQQAEAEKDQIVQRRDLAIATYKTLIQKAKETQITAQDTIGRVKLASPAAVPDRPQGVKTRNTALGLAVGLVLGVLAAFGLDYWPSLRKFLLPASPNPAPAGPR